MAAPNASSLAQRLADDALPIRPLLAGVLAVAFALRAGVAFFADVEWTTPDSERYFEQADAILAGAPIAGFPNGYPLLVALAKAALPEAALAPALIALNVVLSTATVWLVFALASSFRGRTAALLAAVALCLLPNQLVYVHYLLSEAPTAFLLAAGCWALLRGRGAAGGALLALASLFRSTLLPVAPLAVALALWRGETRRLAAGCAAGAALVAALYGGLLAAEVVEPSRNLGSNLLLAVSDTSSGFAWSKERFTADERARPLATYLRFAVEHPGEWLAQRASSLYELWGPYPLDVPRAVWENLLLGLRFPLLLLAIAGFWRHRERFDARLLALAPALLTGVHTAFFSTARFSYVVMPLVVALAAGCLPAPRPPRA